MRTFWPGIQHSVPMLADLRRDIQYRLLDLLYEGWHACEYRFIQRACWRHFWIFVEIVGGVDKVG